MKRCKCGFKAAKCDYYALKSLLAQGEVTQEEVIEMMAESILNYSPWILKFGDESRIFMLARILITEVNLLEKHG